MRNAPVPRARLQERAHRGAGFEHSPRAADRAPVTWSWGRLPCRSVTPWPWPWPWPLVREVKQTPAQAVGSVSNLTSRNIYPLPPLHVSLKLQQARESDQKVGRKMEPTSFRFGGRFHHDPPWGTQELGHARFLPWLEAKAVEHLEGSTWVCCATDVAVLAASRLTISITTL